MFKTKSKKGMKPSPSVAIYETKYKSSIFTPDEVGEFAAVFHQFDKDGDNEISKDDLAKILADLGAAPNNEDIDKMMEMLNVDKNGYINFGEFLKLLEQTKFSTDEQLMQTFKYFDKDHNGFIDDEELIDLMATVGVKLNKTEAQNMIKQIDTNGNGLIDFDEFKNMMQYK